MSKNPITPSGKFRGRASNKNGYREDLGITFRSSWEANYARILKLRQSKGEIADWYYEASTVYLFDDLEERYRSYTPDFIVFYYDDLPWEYHEVKGYMDERSKRVIDLYNDNWRSEYSELVVVDSDVYGLLEKRYSSIIENWE
jgi:hypothetical protein